MSDGYCCAYKQRVVSTTQTILMTCIEKNIQLESLLTNCVHLFSLICLEKSETGNCSELVTEQVFNESKCWCQTVCWCRPIDSMCVWWLTGDLWWLTGDFVLLPCVLSFVTRMSTWFEASTVTFNMLSICAVDCDYVSCYSDCSNNHVQITHYVSKYAPTLASCSFDKHGIILIIVKRLTLR